MVELPDIAAAGAVVLRRGPEVLVVHRPKYDDWSFPKGKLDPGEHVTAAAVREVAEETGIDIRLGPPLPQQRYPLGAGEDRWKRVDWWSARVVGGDDVSTYRPNDEVDAVAWLPVGQARERLSYDRDLALLDALEPVRRKSHPLLVLRHGRAEPRRRWHGPDAERPLDEAGLFQAEQLVPVLGAYGVRRVLSSTSRRCWGTVAPYADVAGLDLEVTAHLAEEKASPRRVERWVRRLLDASEPVVLCTHRPVLAYVYAALGVPATKLEPGALLVVHHRRGEVVAVEQHAL